MKLPVPKSTLIAGGGMLVIAGIIINAERSKPASKTTRERPAASTQRSASPGPSSSATPEAECPTATTIEDPSIKVDPEVIKKRFATKTCSRTPGGEINGCLDADQAACQKRLDSLRRFLKTPGECLSRPTELFCSVHTLANGHVTTACFETEKACGDYHERKKNRPRICRTATACERVPLPS